MAEKKPDLAPKTRRRFDDLRLLLRFWQFVRVERWWVLLAVLVVPIMALTKVLRPQLVRMAIDGPISDALTHQLPSKTWILGDLTFGPYELVTVAMLYLLVVIADFGLRALHQYILQWAGFRALKRLRRAVYAHVIAQGSAFFDTRETGSLLTRTTSDVEALGEVLTFGIVAIFADLFDITAIACAMLYFNVKLTLVSALVAPVIVLVVNIFRKQLRFHSTEIRRSMAAASGHFQEALSGARIIQLHGREQATLDEYRALNFRYLNAYKKSNWYDASLYALMDGVAGLCIAMLIWYGGGQSVSGAVSLGTLVAFIQYIQEVFVPIRELSGKVATIERAMAALERIFGLLDQQGMLLSGPHAPDQVRGAIDVHGLNFGYDPNNLCLHDIDLHVKPGEVVALVGPTGSGKSTLAKLLTRMYDAPNGTILLDNVPLEQWNLTTLRRAIGVVQQDVVLFSGTLAENVSLGRADIGPEKVLQALNDARLDALVARLGSVDVQLAENGANLSAGQRQLLSIARTLAADPPIVVLDEATASIDTETEMLLQSALERVFAGRTAVVVAHRLSTIRKADRIVVLQQGRIVQQGTHEQLLSAGGLYADLVATAAAAAHAA